MQHKPASVSSGKSKTGINFDPFPGRKGLVERTPLIKHSGPRQTQEELTRQQNQERSHSNAENQTFLKDVTNQVLAHALTPIRFSVWDDGSSLNGALRSLKQLECQPTDESGSDSEGADSSSSSYSSLSDFVSEMASSDLSPSLHDVFGSYNRPHVVPQTLSSNLDPALVYHPPSKLQYPEGIADAAASKEEEDEERADSPVSSSSSLSDLSSPSFNRDSEFDFQPKGGQALGSTTTGGAAAPSFELATPLAMRLEATIKMASIEQESDTGSTATGKTIATGSKLQRHPSDTERPEKKIPVSRSLYLSWGRGWT